MLTRQGVAAVVYSRFVFVVLRVCGDERHEDASICRRSGLASHDSCLLCCGSMEMNDMKTRQGVGAVV